MPRSGGNVLVRKYSDVKAWDWAQTWLTGVMEKRWVWQECDFCQEQWEWEKNKARS